MNGETGPKAGPDAATPTLRPSLHLVNDPAAEYACRAANVAAHLAWQRGRSPSNLERLRALQVAGLVPDAEHWLAFVAMVPR